MSSFWQPSCSLALLKLRAHMLHEIRAYFYAHEVMEVETSVLCQYAGTDPYLDYFSTYGGADKKSFYLQSSPEYAMKRLLAANSGSIYQISKAFRRGESGRHHNPEFTMLEWYRVGFNLQQLMDDVERLLAQFLSAEHFPEQAERIPYVHVFSQYTGLNALHFDRLKYQASAESLGVPEADALCGDDHSAWLDFLFSHGVQPHLAKNRVSMVYDYPACLPSLARLKVANPLLTERVEVFIQGMEIGNGFFELADAQEQAMRFEQDILVRNRNNAPNMEKDPRFLAALQSGLPDCSGIAIGLDRLLMIMSQKKCIDDVLAFPVANA